MTMARKRRKSSGQRRKTTRTRGAVRSRAAAPASGRATGAETGVAEPALTAPSETDGESPPIAAAAQPVPAPAAAPVQAQTQSSWPTRRKRSQRVDLPFYELDHVRGDLARIGLLSLGMVAVLVVLTFVLR